MSSSVQTRDPGGAGETQVPDVLGGMRPSAKLVALSLMVNGGQTQKQLVEGIQVSQRTVRTALDDLDEYIESHYNMSDARQKIYHWKGPT